MCDESSYHGTHLVAVQLGSK